MDVYSLGIVLYRLLNRSRTPFLPDFPEPVIYNDKLLLGRRNGERGSAPAAVKDYSGWTPISEERDKALAEEILNYGKGD